MVEPPPVTSPTPTPAPTPAAAAKTEAIRVEQGSGCSGAASNVYMNANLHDR